MPSLISLFRGLRVSTNFCSHPSKHPHPIIPGSFHAEGRRCMGTATYLRLGIAPLRDILVGSGAGELALLQKADLKRSRCLIPFPLLFTHTNEFCRKFPPPPELEPSRTSVALFAVPCRSHFVDVRKTQTTEGDRIPTREVSWSGSVVY